MKRLAKVRGPRWGRWSSRCRAVETLLSVVLSVLSAKDYSSGGQFEQAQSEVLKLLRLGPLLHNRLDFCPEDLALQRLALIRVRRPAVLRVPRRPPPVHQVRLGAPPRPRLHQAVQAQVARERPDPGVAVPPLLLPRPPPLLEALERLLDGAAVGHRLQDLGRRRLGVGAEVRPPAVWLAHDHHPDTAPRRPPGRQEGLDRLDHGLPVLHTLHLSPAALLAGALGQVDLPLAIP